MKLIIGLGNPGKQYENTRHNVGFLVLDEIQKASGFPEFEFSKKFNAQISKDKKIILAKPQTFMNLSGQSVQGLLDFYKLTPADILVIHDDKDIVLGEYRTTNDSSSAGHNGVQNIIDNLGTQKFKRVRIGIGIKKDRLDEYAETLTDTEDFVLQEFSNEEYEKIKNVTKEISKKLF